MKNRRVFFALLFFASLLLLYIALAYVSWHLGFLPRDQSLMERVVTIVFLGMICWGPVGLVTAVMYFHSARQALKKNNLGNAAYNKSLVAGRVIVALLDLAIGGLGYFIITRRIIPWLEPPWLLLFAALSGIVHSLFLRRAQNIKRRYARLEG